MALFKILSNMVDNNPPDPYGYIDNQEDAGLAQVRSEATGLPNTFNQGYCYFDRSTGKFWIDTTPTNSGTVTLSNKNDTSKSHVQGRIPINAYYADLAKLATSATYDDAGNTIASTYLKLSGGNMTGHIYLTGSQANSSTANTSQLIFGTPTTEHIAISSNTKALILNPTHSSTTNQIVLYLDKASKFPFGIEANVKGNLTGKATTAGTADIANSVAWNNVSSKPTTLSGYGITDAKINNGTITLGNNSITPLTSHQSLSGYIPKSTLSGAFDIMYSTSANTPARLGANKTTTKKFLSMTGTGSAGATPVWSTVTQSDVGLSNVENTKLSTWTGSSKITTVGTLSSGTVPWARLSNIPTTFTPAAHTHGPSDLTGLKTLTIGSSSCQVFAEADITIPIYNGTIENTLLATEGVSF